MRLVIDRFEGDVAVLETPDGMVDVLRSFLPAGAREGDALRWVEDEDGTAGYQVDHEATAAALGEAQGALDELNASDDGGDLQL